MTEENKKGEELALHVVQGRRGRELGSRVGGRGEDLVSTAEVVRERVLVVKLALANLADELRLEPALPAQVPVDRGHGRVGAAALRAREPLLLGRGQRGKGGAAEREERVGGGAGAGRWGMRRRGCGGGGGLLEGGLSG